MVIEIALGAGLGALLAVIFNRIAIGQIRTRCDDPTMAQKLNQPAVMTVWCLLSAAAAAYLFYANADWVLRIELLLILSAAVSIAAVDYLIRKIPNETLLILLVIKAAEIVLTLIRGGDVLTTLLLPLVGITVGGLLYIIPALFGIPIGAGDIKYCAVIGFVLGIYGFLQTVLVMAVVLVIYLLYLLITKKGGVKTVAAMGPFLTLGVIATLLVPMTGILNL